MALTKRSTKGSALTYAELDGNFTHLGGDGSYVFPATDGTATHVLATDGNGQLSFVANNGALNDLTDITITSVANGQFLKYNGTAWINSAVAVSDLTTTPTTISGYGITDALQLGTTSTTALAGNTALSAIGGSLNLASQVTGTLPVGNMEATALTTVRTAANEAAQLALTTEEGDVVVRTDENKTYMRNSGTANPHDMTNFTLLATPTDAVTSVDGNTGAVTTLQLGTSSTTALAGNTALSAIGGSLNLASQVTGTIDNARLPSAATNITSVGTLDKLEVASTADTATPGPVIGLYRNSAGPATSDRLGSLRFFGKNASSEKVFYAGIDGGIGSSFADGSHVGFIRFTVADGTSSGSAITDITADVTTDEDPTMTLYKYGLVMGANNDIFLDDVDDVIKWDGGNGQSLRGRASDNGSASTITLPDVTSGTVITTGNLSGITSVGTLSNLIIQPSSGSTGGILVHSRGGNASFLLNGVGVVGDADYVPDGIFYVNNAASATIISDSNTIVGPTTINSNSFEIVSTDDDADSDPTLSLYRNRASAADNDDIGKIKFYGNNDAGTPEKIEYAGIYAEIDDMTDGTEDGELNFYAMAGGSMEDPVMRLDKNGLELLANNDLVFGINSLISFQGDTADSTNKTTLYVTDPTAARAVLLPDASGTLALTTELLSLGTTSTTALAGDTALLALGTSSTTALAGDTALLALGTSSTTALAGDTTFSTLANSSTATDTITIGASAQTGAIAIGNSTAAQTINIANGSNAGGTTNTVNVATTGSTGSTQTINLARMSATGITTNVNIGNTSSSATSNIDLTGNVTLNTVLSSNTQTIGGTTQTGTITLGRSTQTQTIDIAAGDTANSKTTTVKIANTGDSGSTRAVKIASNSDATTTVNVDIGNPNTTATSNLTLNGKILGTSRGDLKTEVSNLTWEQYEPVGGTSTSLTLSTSYNTTYQTFEIPATEGNYAKARSFKFTTSFNASKGSSNLGQTLYTRTSLQAPGKATSSFQLGDAIHVSDSGSGYSVRQIFKIAGDVTQYLGRMSNAQGGGISKSSTGAAVNSESTSVWDIESYWYDATSNATHFNVGRYPTRFAPSDGTAQTVYYDPFDWVADDTWVVIEETKQYSYLAGYGTSHNMSNSFPLHWGDYAVNGRIQFKKSSTSGSAFVYNFSAQTTSVPTLSTPT